VNSSFYSSVYFIPIFTQVMQSQADGEAMWKLQRVWDYFIIVSASQTNILLISFSLVSLVWMEGDLQGVNPHLERLRRVVIEHALRAPPTFVVELTPEVPNSANT